ncbi:uncharacterized protein LOC122259939 [Penaeus japonicus]|uniref:uncharacterized protein LOC122259939 n=1 Tax=Penaeus japonicus TaxID=27405 RepID=UPI001C70B991|nr:uncharacterized protein LOC122259939 [Penaeus japonicus]
MKVFGQMQITLVKSSTLGEDTYQDFWVGFRARVITVDEIFNLLERWIEHLHRRLETMTNELEGSGFIIHKVRGLHINVAHHILQQRLGSFVPYPAGVRGSESIFNPKSKNMSCVIQCIAGYRIHKVKEKTSWSKILKSVESNKICHRHVDFIGVSLPIKWEDLGKLERLNKVSLYIYTLQQDNSVKGGKGKYLLSLARKGTTRYHEIIHLLLLGGEHIALIKDFETYFVNLTRRKPIPPGHYLCFICFSIMVEKLTLGEQR